MSTLHSRIKTIADEINAAYRAEGETIYETARRCAIADSTVEATEKKIFYTALLFSQSRFSKYNSIGKSDRFDAATKPKIPCCFTTIHKLSIVPRPDFAAIMEWITPQTEFADILDFLEERERERSAVANSNSPSSVEQENAVNDVLRRIDGMGSSPDHSSVDASPPQLRYRLSVWRLNVL